MAEFKLMEINKDNFDNLPAGTGAVVRESTTSDNKVLFNACNGSGEPIKALVNTGEIISVVDIIVTSTDVPSERDNPDSEKVSHPVAHFFTDDGKHYSTLSNGIMRGVKLMFATGMTPTPDNPVSLVFKTTETKNGTAHVLDMV